MSSRRLLERLPVGITAHVVPHLLRSGETPLGVDYPLDSRVGAKWPKNVGKSGSDSSEEWQRPGYLCGRYEGSLDHKGQLFVGPRRIKRDRRLDGKRTCGHRTARRGHRKTHRERPGLRRESSHVGQALRGQVGDSETPTDESSCAISLNWRYPTSYNKVGSPSASA